MAEKTLIDLLKTKGSNTAKLIDTGKKIISSETVKQIVPVAKSAETAGKYIKYGVDTYQGKDTTKTTPYLVEVGKEIGKGAKDTEIAIKEIKENKKPKSILANNLYQAVSAIPAAIITPAVKDVLQASGKEEQIAKAFINLGKKEANLVGLKTDKLTDQDFMNLGATNVDAGTALATLGVSKLLSSSLIKGLKIKGNDIKTKVDTTPTIPPTPANPTTKLEAKAPEVKPLTETKITEMLKIKPLENQKIKTLSGEDIKPLSKARVNELIYEKIKPQQGDKIKTIKAPKGIKESIIKEIKAKTLDSQPKKDIVTTAKKSLKPKKAKKAPLKPERINEILKQRQTIPELKYTDIIEPEYKPALSEESITSMLKNQPKINKEIPLEPIKAEANLPKLDKPIKITQPDGIIERIRGNNTENQASMLLKEKDLLESKNNLDLGEELRLKEINNILGNDTQTNIEKIIQKDINKDEDINFELGVVQKVLQKNPVIDTATNTLGKAFIDIRNKLNNVLIRTKDGVRGLGDSIMGLGIRKKQIIDQIIKDFGINDLTQWSKSNSKELLETKNNLQKDLKNLFTKDGKFDDIGYTVANSHLKEQYYEGNFKNPDLDNLRFISNLYFYLKDRKGVDISDKLPNNIKTKLDEIEQKVGVIYDEEGNPINKNSIEYKLISILGDMLEGKGLLRYKKDGYKRGVINKEVFDFLKKFQKELGLEKIPDFEEFIRKGYDTTISQTGDIPKWMSSILKKTKQMEQFHSYDPITRMISYADEVGQLVMNKEIVDFIGKARKNTDINKYIGKDADDFARKILGLHDISSFGKRVGQLSGGLGATAIIGNIPITATSAFTTTLRAIPIILRNFIGLKNLAGFKPKEISKAVDFLEKSGIEQKFLNNSLVQKITGGAYSLFGGGAYDKGVKGVLTSLIMKKQLNEKGINIKKGDDLVGKYQEMINNLSANEQNLLLTDLGRQLSDLSDFSNLSRGQISGLDSRIFNTFKNFSRTTASRYLSYPTQIVNELYSTIANDLSKTGISKTAAQRIAFIAADTIGTYYGAKFLIDKIYPKETEEKKEILTKKLAGGDLVEKLAYLLSFPIQQPGISMINSTFNNIVKLATDISNSGLDKGQIDYTKISGLVRQLSLLMKEKELTSGGTYKYSNKWGDSTIQNAMNFILGMSDGRLNYEEAKKNIEKINEKDKGLASKIVEKIMQDQNYFYSGLGETADILKYALGDRNTQNEFYNFKVRSESKKNIDNLLSNIDYNKNKPLSVEQWIAGAWDGFDIKYDDKEILTFMKNNLSTNTTEKKALLKMIDELGVNNDPLYKGDMNEYMEKIKTTNPALFYQIMKKVINPVVIKIDKNSKEIKDLEYTGSATGNSFVDEILVDRYENLPRLSSDISNRFQKIIQNPTREDIESYNTLLETTKKLPYLWDDIRDSIATVIGTQLKDVEGIKDLLQGQDNVIEMIKQAAILRGIEFDNGEDTQLENTQNLEETQEPEEQKIQTNNTLKSNLDLKGLILKNEKKSPLPQIVTTKKQISPLTTQVTGVGGTTLAEILRRR